MLWLPDPRAPRLPPRIAVADASAEALELILLAPHVVTARWAVADALVRDPWLVTWVDAWQHASNAELEPSPWANACWLAEHAPQLADVWSHRGAAAWPRPLPEAGERMARVAVAEPTLPHAADEVPVEIWQRRVRRCRALPAAAGLGIPVDRTALARYQAERPGVDRRLPQLVHRLATLPQSPADFAHQLRDAKLASLVELAYGASHEINNPLANIAGRAQTLLVDEAQPDRRRLIAAIQQQALRAHEMISDLMLFGRPPALQHEAIDFLALTRQIADELSPAANQQDIAISLHYDQESLIIAGDRQHLQVMLRAVFQNAIQAIGFAGHVTVNIDYDPAQPTHVETRICDTGPGLSEREVQHAFDPFFSGREAGRGLGFGLSKAWQIVTLHGGTITIDNRLTGGAEVVIRLPVATSDPPE